MSLEKATKDYEILIRFNENGKIGAQQQQITTITDSGAVLSAKLEDARPINLEELKHLVNSLKEEDWWTPEEGEGTE